MKQVTNEVEKAARFIDSYERGAIVKVLGKPAILRKRKAATLYTHLILKKTLNICRRFASVQRFCRSSQKNR
jgi:hypothetical protein